MQAASSICIYMGDVCFHTYVFSRFFTSFLLFCLFCVMVFVEKLEALLFYHPAIIAFFFEWWEGGVRGPEEHDFLWFWVGITGGWVGCTIIWWVSVLCLAVEGMKSRGKERCHILSMSCSLAIILSEEKKKDKTDEQGFDIFVGVWNLWPFWLAAPVCQRRQSSFPIFFFFFTVRSNCVCVCVFLFFFPCWRTCNTYHHKEAVLPILHREAFNGRGVQDLSCVAVHGLSASGGEGRRVSTRLWV